MWEILYHLVVSHRGCKWRTEHVPAATKLRWLNDFVILGFPISSNGNISFGIRSNNLPCALLKRKHVGLNYVQQSSSLRKAVLLTPKKNQMRLQIFHRTMSHFYSHSTFPPAWCSLHIQEELHYCILCKLCSALLETQLNTNLCKDINCHY